jgi:subtilisin family serine protease
MTALSLALVISLLSGSSTPQPGQDVPPPMVVMKVAPEWAGVLPKDVSRASGIPALDQRLQEVGVARVKRLHPNARVRPDLPRLDLVLELHLQPGADPARVVAALRGRPEVEYIEAVPVPMIEEVPNDPQYIQQYHLMQIKAPQAWDHQKGDSSVVIALVDGGFDYTHPDLEGNVFTNEVEAAGIEGVDDDGNGYVDDVHGYDLAEDDPDPSAAPPDALGYWKHGTEVAGNAAAVTNNGLGIAAVSWNCEYLPIKASYDATPRYISVGYPGITYAAEMGADVINCSWGSFGSFSQYNQDVIDYATGLGALVVASAGNEATGGAHYPSSYLHVVGVTWVNDSDRRDSDATWGRTVDISAPGVNTRSTAPDAYYEDWSGSSAAAPIAAGLAALVKSGRPELGPRDLARQLVLTADNIDARNPGYEGLLGTGRINALRAVTEEELEEYVYLGTWSYVLTDSAPDGNDNGLLEQGETASLRIIYRSYTVGTAGNATLTLSTSAPGLTVVSATSYEGDVPGDTLLTCQQPLGVYMDPQAPSQAAELLVTYEAADGFWQQDTLLLNAGGAPVLFVDDDDGANNVEGYYLTVLDSLGVPRVVWTYATQGQPDSTFLLNFPVVIWACEWTFPSLDAADRAAVGSYLDHGGSLFMSGQDIGWSLCEPSSQYYTPDAAAWYQEYLHAEYILDDSNIQSVTGVERDPIGDDLAFGIYQPGRDADQQFPSVIAPHGPDVHAVLRYGPDMDACVRYRNDHSVVYMAFGSDFGLSRSDSTCALARYRRDDPSVQHIGEYDVARRSGVPLACLEYEPAGRLR